MCMCVHVAAVITHPLPISFYPLLLSLTLSSPLPLQYLSCSFLPVPAGETRAFCFSAGSAPASLRASRVLSCPPTPLQPMSPPVGFVGQPASLAVAAAAAGAVELSDTTLLRRYRSASLLLSAFRLTLSFAG